MTREQLQKLIDAHNFAIKVSVKGDDAIIMANCIIALRELITEISAESINEGEQCIVDAMEQ